MNFAMVAIRASVVLKIGIGLVGLGSAVCWIYAAYSVGEIAASWNQWAAIGTAVAMTLRAISAFIDSRYSPLASWG